MADKKSFELDAGLPNDYEVLVEGAEFGYRDRYRGGDVPLLIWYCDSPEMESREELFSIGSGWEVVPGGGRVEGREKFLASSWLGRVIMRCNELDMPDFEGGDNGTVLDFIAERGEAQDASIWVGLKFIMTREDVDFGGDWGVRSHIMPTECLGFVEVEAKSDAESFGEGGEVEFEGPAVGTEEPLAASEPQPDTSPQDDVVNALLKPLAQDADTVTAFQTAAVSQYAANLNDDQLSVIMDQAKAEKLYKELRG